MLPAPIRSCNRKTGHGSFGQSDDFPLGGSKMLRFRPSPKNVAAQRKREIRNLRCRSKVERAELAKILSTSDHLHLLSETWSKILLAMLEALVKSSNWHPHDYLATYAAHGQQNPNAEQSWRLQKKLQPQHHLHTVFSWDSSLNGTKYHAKSSLSSPSRKRKVFRSSSKLQTDEIPWASPEFWVEKCHASVRTYWYPLTTSGNPIKKHQQKYEKLEKHLLATYHQFNILHFQVGQLKKHPFQLLEWSCHPSSTVMGKPVSYNTLRKRMAAKDWPPNLGLVATTQVMFHNMLCFLTVLYKMIMFKVFWAKVQSYQKIKLLKEVIINTQFLSAQDRLICIQYHLLQLILCLTDPSACLCPQIQRLFQCFAVYLATGGQGQLCLGQDDMRHHVLRQIFA